MIYGFDLSSTVVGWSVVEGGRPLASGSWKIDRKVPGTGPGIRWLLLLEHLRKLAEHHPAPKLVAYEQVTFIKEGAWRSQQRWGGAEAILLLWTESLGLRESQVATIHVSDVKAVATGKGGGRGTGKDAVLRAARHRWRRLKVPDADAADAIFVAIAADLGMHETRKRWKEIKRKAGRSRRGGGKNSPQRSIDWR